MTRDNSSSIGFVHLLSNVCGGILGVSLITLPELLCMYGYSAYIGWCISMPLVLALASMFAKLSVIMPGEGGPYGYCKRQLGAKFGRFVGYLHLCAMLVMQSAVLQILQTACISALPAQYTGYYWQCLILPTVLCGLSQSSTFATHSKVNFALNIIKTVPFVILLAASLLPMPTAAVFHCNTAAGTDIFSALSVILFGFMGMEFSTVNKTDEVQDPEKNIPAALVLGTALSAVIFFALHSALFFSGCTSLSLLSDRVLFSGASRLFVFLKVLLAVYATNFGIIAAAHLMSHIFETNASTNIWMSTLVPVLLLVCGATCEGQFIAFVQASDLLSTIVFGMCTAVYYAVYGLDLVALFSALGVFVFLYATLSVPNLFMATTIVIIALLAAIKGLQ